MTKEELALELTKITFNSNEFHYKEFVLEAYQYFMDELSHETAEYYAYNGETITAKGGK